jgi:hypothetical protein
MSSALLSKVRSIDIMATMEIDKTYNDDNNEME